MDIGEWLRSLGLERYEQAFRDNDIEAEMLPKPTADDLIALGVASIGHRRKLLTEIAAFAEVAEPRATAKTHSDQAPRSAERRQLTVMFVDLVSSTELSQQLDPEDMREIISGYQNAVSGEIRRYEGQVAKLMGDGVLAYFGWPRAHEDDAERAIRSGLAAIAAVAGLRTPGSMPLAARVGIATGLVVVGDLIGEGAAQEEAVVGDTPNLAARLQSLAEPNAVVASDGTLRLVSGLFEAVDLGRREIKGFGAPLQAWRIVGEAAGIESRFHAIYRAAPLAGRTEELELLFQRWHRARAGEGQVVLLSGEPGIGKSRLTVALTERLTAEPHGELRYFCSPYHAHSALHPVIKQLERAAGLERHDDANVRLDKLEATFGQSVDDSGEALPLLAALLSIHVAGRYPPLNIAPPAHRARTLAALVRQVETLSASQPIMVLVEDTHWMDPTTGEWLDMLIDRIQNLNALIVVTFRPEFRPRWTRFSHVSTLSLSRLGRGEGTAIIDRVTEGKALPVDVSDQILAKTEGIPLFVEELTKTVLESGLLIEAGDRFSLSGPLPSFAIPSTLQDSLMARLDRLASAKEVAQIGACIGRVFSHRLLSAVTDATHLVRELQQLEDSGLVFRRGVAPEATYAFKHALVQDAAYQSLLKSRRSQIHAKIAAVLEAQFPETAETEPETLAHHYTAAGLAHEGSGYWLKAGQQALKRSAHVEALAHTRKGVELVGSLPRSESRLRREIQLQNVLGVILMSARGWGAPEVLTAFSSAQKLAEELGDQHELFIAIRGEASYRMISGNLRVADELGHRCLDIAEASGNHDMLIEAYHQMWSTKFFIGDLAAAGKYTQAGIASYDPDRDHRLTYIYTGHDPGVCGRNFHAQILWLLGFPDRALDQCRDTVALAERVGHPLSRIQAQNASSIVHLLRREPLEARRWLERWSVTADELALPMFLAGARLQFGRALAEEGHAKEGVAEMRAGLAAISATGAAMELPYQLCLIARACGAAGEVEEGLAEIERALGIAEADGTEYQLPELLRTKGELFLRLNPRDDAAEEWLQKSLSAARDSGAKSLELRAAISLSRLCSDRGHPKEARHALAPVYAWFTEGFDTPDLVEAKALLATLS